MLSIFKKISNFILSHKIISVLLAVGIILGGWYGYSYFHKNQNSVKYVVAAATKGTLISSVSGTGQVSTSSEVALNSKVSGEVTYVGVTAGEDADNGKVLLKIDPTDAEQAVRDAQASYDLAVLSLNELKAPVDELTLMQAEDALTSAKNSKTNTESSLSKAYDDGFNTVSSAFLDLPDIMSGLYDVIYGQAFNNYQGNADFYSGGTYEYAEKSAVYKQDVFTKYAAARAAYDKNLDDYKKTNRFSSTDNIESLISETYETTKLMAEAVKSTNNLIQFYKDQMVQRGLNYNTLATTHLATLNNYTSKTNSLLTSLLANKQTVQTNKDSLASADRTIAEKQISLDKVKAGATEIELKSQELSVEQKYNALLTAKENLADCYVKAPFSGTVAKVSVSKGNSVSSGNSLVTFISKGKIVNVSLNEVDVTKVKVGDSVTLTFDAITDLTLTGKVAEVDTVGTVSSGVVNYNVKISFDDDTGQVKPGMTASASIITETKTDVLLVPNSAIKSSGDTYYVETPEKSVSTDLLNNTKGIALSGNIQKRTVEIGSANDSYTEITSGLSENDQVISSTVKTSSSAKSSSSSKSSTSGSTKSNTSGESNMVVPGMGGGPPN